MSISKYDYRVACQHLIDHSYMKNVRMVIYDPSGYCIGDKMLFGSHPNSVWYVLTGVSQVSKDTRVTPVYYKKHFYGFIVMLINCDRFDRYAQQVKDKLISLLKGK